MRLEIWYVCRIDGFPCPSAAVIRQLTSLKRVVKPDAPEISIDTLTRIFSEGRKLALAVNTDPMLGFSYELIGMAESKNHGVEYVAVLDGHKNQGIEDKLADVLLNEPCQRSASVA